MAEKVEAIHGAICAMLAEVAAIAKERKNVQQGFTFRGIDDIYNTVHPVLAKCKVYPRAEIMESDHKERATKNGGVQFFVRLKIRYHLVSGIDGSSVWTEVIGEAADTGDKAYNKAMSIAYKYGFCQLLCIPTEAIDPDAFIAEPTKAERPADKPADKPAKEQPKPAPKAPPKSADKPAEKPKPEVFPPEMEVLERANKGPIDQLEDVERLSNRMRVANKIDAGIHLQVLFQSLRRRIPVCTDLALLSQYQTRAKGYLERKWFDQSEVDHLNSDIAKRIPEMTKGVIGAE
jgi:hypothetical protein